MSTIQKPTQTNPANQDRQSETDPRSVISNAETPLNATFTFGHLVFDQYIFVESGATELHDQGRICGSLDVPLSESGQHKIAQLSEQLAAIPVTRIYAAACLAANETAAIIAKHHRTQVKVVDSWQNLNHGLWHGRCEIELKETLPKFYRQWQESPQTIAPPQGETYTDVADRCSKAVQRIKARNLSGSVLIIAPQPLLHILSDLFTDDANRS